MITRVLSAIGMLLIVAIALVGCNRGEDSVARAVPPENGVAAGQSASRDLPATRAPQPSAGNAGALVTPPSQNPGAAEPAGSEVQFR